MKAKKLKTYRKPKKFISGTQNVDPNLDPTQQYQVNRGGVSAKDTGFNNTQQGLLNRDITQQQYQDKANQSYQNIDNTANSTKGARSTASGIANAFGPIGMAVGAGIGVAGGIGDSLNKKVADKELAGGKRDYATRGVANVVDPTTNLIQGLGLDGGGMNGSDLVSGLTAGLINLKGSKEDKAIDEAKYQKKMNDTANTQIKSFGKVDTTQQAIQVKKGSKKLKTRIIETEGREPVFSPKDKSGKRDLLYYNPQAPTHEKGGVKAAVIQSGKDKIKGMLNIPKGSAIVTANDGKNKQALEAYKKGDDKKLEKIINKMPEDGNKKKFWGDSNLTTVNPDDSINSLNKSLDSKINTVGILPKSYLGMTGNNVKEGFASGGGYHTDTPEQVSTDQTKKSYGSSILNKVNNGLQAAPSIYNLSKGIFEKPVKTTRRYMSNEGFKYNDFSNPNRRAANEQNRVESDNIRNATGGSGGAFLANQALASANRFKNISDINNQESAKRLDVQNANTGLRNQQRQTNLGLANQYDDLDLQNKGAKNSFISAGLTGISDLSFNKELMKNQANTDRLRANTLETNNYKYSTQDEKNVFKDKGTKKLKGSNSIRYKKK